jgi:hypothetical protein
MSPSHLVKQLLRLEQQLSDENQVVIHIKPWARTPQHGAQKAAESVQEPPGDDLSSEAGSEHGTPAEEPREAQCAS